MVWGGHMSWAWSGARVGRRGVSRSGEGLYVAGLSCEFERSIAERRACRCLGSSRVEVSVVE